MDRERVLDDIGRLVKLEAAKLDSSHERRMLIEGINLARLHGQRAPWTMKVHGWTVMNLPGLAFAARDMGVEVELDESVEAGTFTLEGAR